MKKNLFYSIICGLAAIGMIVFAVLEWPQVGEVIRNVIFAVIFAFLSWGNAYDARKEAKGKATEDERDTQVTLKADHRALVGLLWISFFLFIVFIVFYFLDNHNLILGVMGFLSLFYFTLSWVLQIIFAFIENAKS